MGLFDIGLGSARRNTYTWVGLVKRPRPVFLRVPYATGTHKTEVCPRNQTYIIGSQYT